jgi:hypothetical protein
MLDAEEYHDQLLSQAKPVLRKKVIHNDKNVFLNFKSIQVQVVEESSFKFLTPVYVAPDKLKEYLLMDSTSLELRVLRQLFPVKKGEGGDALRSESGAPTLTHFQMKEDCQRPLGTVKLLYSRPFETKDPPKPQRSRLHNRSTALRTSNIKSSKDSMLKYLRKKSSLSPIKISHSNI